MLERSSCTAPVTVRLAALLFALGLCSCAGVPHRRHALIERTHPQVVLVYPFHFRWPQPPWHAFQRTRDLVEAARSDGRFRIFDPGDFEVYRPADDNVLAASTVLAPLTEGGWSPQDAVVLRGWAEERVATSASTVYDRSGRRKATVAREDRTHIVHVDLIDVASGTLLLESWKAVPFDPFAPRSDTDPLPGVGEAVRELGRFALAQISASGTPPPALGLELAPNPARAFHFRVQASALGAQQALARLDPMQQEAVKLALYASFDPDLSPTRIALYDRAPDGAVVLRVTGPPAAAAGLEAGDLVVRAGDAAVTGPETLERLARRGEALPLEVIRGRQHLRLVLHP
ncbi:MAG: PDZ domain-containing protein [Deltaproteobacteria bacterium]|nr:MAG: PDZ domain-containing protein [Deltaproteobacteria bacterium]